MLFEDSYITIKENARSEYKDRGSKFYGYALKTSNKKEFDNWYKKLKTKYPDATHHCYAYILHPDKSESYSSDDGEPANSAGKPILRAIQSHEATQISVVVVRYYGGVNLGIPGLINAYGIAAKLAIEKAMLVSRDIEEVYHAKCNYGDEQQWYSLLNSSIITIVSQSNVELGYEAVFSSSKSNSDNVQELLGKLFEIEVKFLHFQ